jgi:menaquinone-dependent protoporphyrinogen oxidase
MTVGADFLKPQLAGPGQIRFPESSCSVGTMNAPEILVTYASMFGSTGDVATAIGQALCRHGAKVDLQPLKAVSELEACDAVVVGSAIRSSRWLPETTEFVEGHQKTLVEMPLAYFLCCLALARPDEEKRKEAEEFLDPVKKSIPSVNPVDIGLFAGVLDYSKMSFLMRTIMKRKMKQKGILEND